MGFSFENNFNRPNHYQIINSIRNAFNFKKERVNRIINDRYENNSFMREFAIDYLRLLDSTFDDFILVYPNPHISVKRKDIVKKTLDEYLIELDSIQKDLGLEMPNITGSKLLFEINNIQEVLQTYEEKLKD
jgi:hypothetical protein